MEAVYYYNQKLKHCPVKKYLEQYLIINKDKTSDYKRKQKILADIDRKIKYVEKNNGRPTPPISKPLHGYNFFEILNPKDARTIIRICYFRFEEKIVLLHAFEKPANYNTNRERKKVEKEYDLADEYLKIFKLTPKNYEKYQ